MAKKTTAKTPAAKTAPVAAEVAETKTEDVQVMGTSKKNSWEDSLNRLRSTGNDQVDKVCRKILTAIHDKSLAMDGDTSKGFKGKYKDQIAISVTKITMQSKIEGKKETSRYQLAIGEGDKKILVSGGFAAKAFAKSKQQHTVHGQPAFDAEAVSMVAALLMDEESDS